MRDQLRSTAGEYTNEPCMVEQYGHKRRTAFRAMGNGCQRKCICWRAGTEDRDTCKALTAQ